MELDYVGAQSLWDAAGLTPGSERTDGAIRRAHHIMESAGDRYFMPNQFDNPQNYLSHTIRRGRRSCGKPQARSISW